MSKNILFTLAMPDRTGASRMALQYATALVKAGYRVTLAHGLRASDERDPDYILYEMLDASIRLRSVKGLARPWSPLVSKRVARVGREVNASAIVGFNQIDRPIALSAAHQLGIPGIVSGQNQHRFHGPRFIQELKAFRYRSYVSRLMTLGICSSMVVQDEFIKRFKVTKQNLTIVPNGINTRAFERHGEEQRQAIRKNLGVNDNTLFGLMVGRLNSQKGYNDAVAAVARADKSKQWKIFIVGGDQTPSDTKYFEALKQQVSELKLEDRIEFLGWREDVKSLLGAADFYLHTAHWEGWSLAAMEAMAAGLPIIMTDCSGRPVRFVDGEHGYVVRTKDTSEITRGINEVINWTNQKRKTAGEKCSLIAQENYDISRTSQMFVNAIESQIST